MRGQCRRGERGREPKERERVVGKAAGDECVFIPGEGPSWQMKSSDTIPEAAGGEGGYGGAKTGGGNHKYLFLPNKNSLLHAHFNIFALSASKLKAPQNHL